MNERSRGLPHDEIVISLLPAFSGIAEEEAMGAKDPQAPLAYDALIYASLAGPWQTGAVEPPPGQSSEIGSQPLAGVERLGIRWDRFRDYQAALSDGQPLGAMLRESLIESMTPGLDALLTGEVASDRPVRLWWFTRAPELAELPWELLARARPAATEGRLSFVRGRPRGRTPFVPLRGQPRLAFVHDPATTSEALRATLDNLAPAIDVMSIAEPTRSAVARAVGEHCELVHLVANGKVSLGFDGILEPGGAVDEPLAPGDLSRILSGSRVSILALTPATGVIESEHGKSAPPRGADHGGPGAPTYRAFAYLGLSQEPLPTIVAPLAPIAPPELSRFWGAFYEQLAETLSVEEAFGQAQAGGDPLPIALFLRHRLGQIFVRGGLEAASNEPDLTQISSELRVSRDLLDQLRGIHAAYGNVGDEAPFAPLLDKEMARQERLQDQLSTWSTSVEDEG